jgi:hypothetical protein
MADDKANVAYIDGRERMIEMLDWARQMVEAGEVDGIAMAMSIAEKEKGIEHAWTVRNDGDAVRLLGAVVRLQRRIEDSFVTSTPDEEEDEHGT